MTAYSQGEVWLARLVFTDGQESKRRPVLVLHDFGDDDLLVAPVTSHPPRTGEDVAVGQWQEAGLKLASTIRVGKLATIEKSCLERRLGSLRAKDHIAFREVLGRVLRTIEAG